MKLIHIIFHTLLTVFIIVIFIFLGLFLLISSISETKPNIKDNSTLNISLSGDIPEYQIHSNTPFEDKLEESIKSIIDNITKAKVDERIKGILLRIHYNSMGWAKIDEIKQKLADFKSSGKYVIAYLGSFVAEKDYFMALAADSIFAVPGSFMEMNGLVIETIHFPGFLKKLGITLDYYAFGKYKSRSGESYGRTKHSAPVLDMMDDILDWEYNYLVSGIAQRLNISTKEVKSVFDNCYVQAEKFKEIGWLDGVLYEDQLYDRLKKINNTYLSKRLNQVSSSQYAEIPLESLGLNKGKNRIAIIYSQGVIMEGDDDYNPLLMSKSAGINPTIQALKRAVRNKSVKAIIYRVNSPGGSGIGCDLVWREIQKAKQTKPVIVSMSDYAASGGYWVSMGATAIVAQPSTITGSIGVWGIFPNISGLYDKLGLIEENVKRGKHADIFLAVKKMTEYEKNIIRNNIYSTYTTFVSKAAQSRGKTYNELEPYAQGRSWMGEQAKKIGLIDELGGMDQAIELATKKAGLDSTQKVKVVVYTIQKSWIEELLINGILFKGWKYTLQKDIYNTWETILSNRRLLIWPMMPYKFKIS